MTQKIKIQDGSITYTTPDPLLPLEFNVSGNVIVRDSINVGDTLLEDAVISTPDGTPSGAANLEISTGAYGVLSIHQHSTGGSLLLNNARWPSGVVQPNPGMFIGVSALNELEYFPFVLGFTPSNILTNIDLINLYPDAVPGQSLVGPDVIYSCVGPHIWRALGQTSAPPPGSAPETLVIRLTSNSLATLDGNDYGSWSVDNPVEIESIDAYWDSYSGMLNLVTPGAYEIKIKARVLTDVDQWPIDNVRYGTLVSNALSGFERSEYYRGVDNWPSVPSMISGSDTWWEDTFIVKADSPNWASSIFAYAESTSYPLTSVSYRLLVSVTRLLGTIPHGV